MDIRQMHINFHLLRKQNLGNDYTHLQSEAIDDLLNIVINDFIRLKINNPDIQEGQANLLVDQYYEGLESLIRTAEVTALRTYPFNTMGKVVDLHSINAIGSNKYSASGTLISGTTCKMLAYQTGDDFTNLNGDNSTGAVFKVVGDATYQPSSMSSGYVLGDSNNNFIAGTATLKAGESYTVHTGTITFDNDTMGTLGVTVDGITYINGVNLTTDLVINSGSTFIINDTLTPSTWTNATVIEVINADDEYYKLISSVSEINYSIQGTPTNIMAPNRTYKSRDVDLYLAHGRGTVLSSPISHLEGGELVVYENQNSELAPIHERFSITKVYVKYYKKPNTVSLSQGIDCDLNEIDHDEIVRKAVELSTAADTATNFQYLEANNRKNSTI